VSINAPEAEILSRTAYIVSLLRALKMPTPVLCWPDTLRRLRP
jgi:hypothetical protein